MLFRFYALQRPDFRYSVFASVVCRSAPLSLLSPFALSAFLLFLSFFSLKHRTDYQAVNLKGEAETAIVVAVVGRVVVAIRHSHVPRTAEPTAATQNAVATATCSSWNWSANCSNSHHTDRNTTPKRFRSCHTSLIRWLALLQRDVFCPRCCHHTKQLRPDYCFRCIYILCFCFRLSLHIPIRLR